MKDRTQLPEKTQHYYEAQGYNADELAEVAKIIRQERISLRIVAPLNVVFIVLSNKGVLPTWLFWLWIVAFLVFMVQLFRWDYQKSHAKKH